MRLLAVIYLLIYLLMVVVMFILPSFSFEGYSRISNTLSELGAQNTPYNWVMNVIFVLMAVAVLFLASNKIRSFWLPLSLIFIFAISFGLTGIFKHASAIGEISSIREHGAHSFFANVTGVAFSAYCIAISFFLKNQIEKASCWLLFALTVGLSILMFQAPEYRGMFQRILFIVSFGWLYYSLVTFHFQHPNEA